MELRISDYSDADVHKYDFSGIMKVFVTSLSWLYKVFTINIVFLITGRIKMQTQNIHLMNTLIN